MYSKVIGIAFLLLFCFVQLTPVAMAGLAAPPSVTYTQVAVNVTTTSAEVLATNNDRKWVIIQNLSDTVIHCKVGATAVVIEPIQLNANGGSFEISPQLGNFNTGAINCIHGGTGDKVLGVVEGE